MLLNILQSTGQPLPLKNDMALNVNGARLKNPGIGGGKSEREDELTMS